jgi:hypothetical protein
MSKVLDWFTRNKITAILSIMVIVYVVSYFNKILGLPYSYDNFCCVDDRVANLFLLFIPISVIYIFVLFSQRESLFLGWKKYTFFYMLLYFMVYFVVPTQGDGLVWFQRETVSFFGSVLYFLISLVVIVYKSINKSPQNQ